MTRRTDWQQTEQLRGHRGAVYALAWSPDGTTIASASSDGTICLWNAKAGKPLLCLEAHEGSAWGLAWAPDGRTLASAGADGAVRLWNPVNGTVMREIPGSEGCAFCVAWEPGGQALVSGHADGTLKYHVLEPGKTSIAWPGHTSGGLSTEVIAAAWSPRGETFATGGIDFAVRLWTPARACLAVIRAKTEARNDINGLAWSPDGRTLAAAGQDGTIRLWDPMAKRELAVLSIGPAYWTRGVAWSPDGLWLATTGGDGYVRLWDPLSGECLQALQGHESPIWSVAWSPDGKNLASGSGPYEAEGGDCGIRIWHASDSRGED